MAEVLAYLKTLYANRQYDDIICYFEITNYGSEQHNNAANSEYQAWAIFAKSLFKRRQYARSLAAFRTCLSLLDSNVSSRGANKSTSTTSTVTSVYKRPKVSSTHVATKDGVSKTEIKYKMHLCLRELKKPSEAIAALESIDAPDRGVEVFQALAELYTQEENIQLASLNYRELIRRSPLSLNAIKQLCRLRQEDGLTCDEIVKLVPHQQVERKSLLDWMPDYIKANYYMHSANSKEAIKYWQKLHEKFISSPAIQAGLAQSLYQHGEYQEAMSNFQLAFKIDYLYVTHMDSYAACLAQLDVDELETLSARIMEKCENEGDHLFEPWIVLGYHNTIQKEPKPYHFVQKAQKINRFSVEAAILHAKLCYTRRDYTKAISQGLLALKQAPYRFEAHKIICESHVAENRKATAVKFAQNQIKQFGETARALHLYAKTVLSGTDNRSKKSAKLYLEKALQLDPSYQPAVVVFSKLLMDEKNHDQAIEVLETALKSHSTNATMHGLLSECYMAKGDHDTALHHHNFATVSKIDIARSKLTTDTPETTNFKTILDADSNLDLEVNEAAESEASETDMMSD